MALMELAAQAVSDYCCTALSALTHNMSAFPATHTPAQVHMRAHVLLLAYCFIPNASFSTTCPFLIPFLPSLLFPPLPGCREIQPLTPAGRSARAGETQEVHPTL